MTHTLHTVVCATGNSHWRFTSGRRRGATACSAHLLPERPRSLRVIALSRALLRSTEIITPTINASHFHIISAFICSRMWSCRRHRFLHCCLGIQGLIGIISFSSIIEIVSSENGTNTSSSNEKPACRRYVSTLISIRACVNLRRVRRFRRRLPTRCE